MKQTNLKYFKRAWVFLQCAPFFPDVDEEMLEVIPCVSYGDGVPRRPYNESLAIYRSK